MSVLHHRIVIIIVFQFGLSRPTDCNNDVSGRHYLATVCLTFGSYSASFMTECAINCRRPLRCGLLQGFPMTY